MSLESLQDRIAHKACNEAAILYSKTIRDLIDKFGLQQVHVRVPIKDCDTDADGRIAAIPFLRALERACQEQLKGFVTKRAVKQFIDEHEAIKRRLHELEGFEHDDIISGD